MRNLWKDDHAIRLGLLGVSLVLIYGMVLCPLGFLQGARAASGDALLRWRMVLSGPPSQIRDFLLVTVDDESQRHLNQRWPWDRSLFAEFLRRITPHAPRMVLFDFAFLGTGRPESDAALAQAIQAGPPILLAAYLDPQGELMLPQPVFLQAGGIPGLVNKPMDKDRVVRRTWGAVRLPDRAELLYGIEIRSAAQIWGVPPEQIQREGKNLLLGSRRIPVGRLGELPINFLATPESFPRISFWKILQGPISPDPIRGKTIIVGSTREIIHDVHPTPLNRMPGMAIEANGILTLITGRFLEEFPLWAALLGSLLLVIGILQLTYRAPLAAGILGTAGLTAAIFVGCLFFASRDISAEFVSPMILAGTAWLTGFLYKHLVLTAGTLRLQRQAIRDGLTGAFTARYFKLCMKEHLQRPHSSRRPFALLLVQAAAGMQLENLVSSLQQALPPQGLMGRLREDRFGLFLPNIPIPRAREIAAKLRASFQSSGVLALGLAGSEQIPRGTGEGLIQCAEAALQRAQAKGNGALEEYNPATDKIQSLPPGGSEVQERTTQLEYVASELEERNRSLEKALAELRQVHEQLESSFLEVTKSLVLALETKDAYTAGHLERVSRYSTRLAEVLGLPKEDVEAIREAALLHDIGKIGLPDEVLHKIGKLTHEEREIMKQHLSIGAKILEPMKFFRAITTLIYHHHEWYNGKGYPHGLAGDFIPAGAQIIAIADAFDAMTTHRGYNNPITTQEAVAELERGAGEQFNPLYVGKFAELMVQERAPQG